MFIYCNPNPCKTLVGDCVIRAISIAEQQSWEETYVELCGKGYKMCDMPSSNEVWGEYLNSKGYKCYVIPFPIYSVRQFCNDYKSGRYVVGTGSHAIAVINGDIYDTWDSSDETPAYYWRKEV